MPSPLIQPKQIDLDKLQTIVISDKFYEHQQTVASSIWIVDHGFGREPNIVVLMPDGNGGEEQGLVSPEHIYNAQGICNRSLLHYDYDTSGRALCN